MSEKFSATLRIGDLNDFIAPSQACIVSLKGLTAAAATKQERAEVADLLRFLCFCFFSLPWRNYRVRIVLVSVVEFEGYLQKNDMVIV